MNKMTTASGMMQPKLEMDQIKECKMFKDIRRAKTNNKSSQPSNAPVGYQKIRVHLVFTVKHYACHKARLVAGGHLAPEPVESIYILALFHSDL